MTSFSQQLYEQSIHYKKSNIENYSIYDAIIEVAKLDPDEYYVHNISTRAIIFFNKVNYRKFIGFQYNPQRLFVIMSRYKYSDREEDLIKNHESLVNEIKNFTPLFFLNNKNESEDFYLSITNDDINGAKTLKEIETIKDNPFFYEKSIEDARLSCRIKYVKTISFSPENLEHKFYIEYIFLSAYIKHRFNIDLHVDDFNFLFLDTVVNELFKDSFLVSNPSIFDQIQFDENNRLTNETKNKFGKNHE